MYDSVRVFESDTCMFVVVSVSVCGYNGCVSVRVCEKVRVFETDKCMFLVVSMCVRDIIFAIVCANVTVYTYSRMMYL